MTLKSQDLLLSLKILTLGRRKWTQRMLAQDLGMSLSETNEALRRATGAGLLLPMHEGMERPLAIPSALEEFVRHGVRYAFPPKKGGVGRGIPTGLGAIGRAYGIVEDELSMVWPSASGKERGVILEPLYPSIPKIAQLEENEALYHLLALLDGIRAGRAREKKIAAEELSREIKGMSHGI